MEAKGRNYKVTLIIIFFVVLAWSLHLSFLNALFHKVFQSHYVCAANIPYLSAALGLLRPLIYIGLFVAWGIKVSHSVTNRSLRRYLEYIALCCIVWMLLRIIKYEMTNRGDELNMFLQYTFYIPFVMIPTFSFFASLHTRRSTKYEIPKKLHFFVLCVSSCMILLALTNKYHNLVWGPVNGVLTGQSYIHEVGYYIILTWILFLAVFSVAVILARAKVPNKRYVVLKPLIIFGIIIGYFAIKWAIPGTFWFISNDWSAFTCLSTLVFLDSCLNTGMIPTNREYKKLFHASAVNMIITDDDWNVCYHTDNADIYDKEILKLTECERVEKDQNTLIQGYNLNPGHAIWIEDISELINVINRLQKNKDELSARCELDKENSKTKLELHRVQEKNRLYDLFQKATARQNALLEEILENYFRETNEQIRRSLLAKAAVIGAYIKRKGNMILAAERNGKIPAEELKLCFQESIKNVELMGVQTLFDFCANSAKEWSFKTASLIYDTFEMALEAALEDCDSIYIKITENDGKISVFFSINTKRDISKLIFPPRVSIEWDNGSWGIGISALAGGKGL